MHHNHGSWKDRVGAEHVAALYTDSRLSKLVHDRVVDWVQSQHVRTHVSLRCRDPDPSPLAD